MSPVDGRHPPAPPPRCSCYQAEACCAAGSLGPCGAPRSRHIDQHQPRVAGTRHGVRCKAIHITEFGVRRFISWGRSEMIAQLGTILPEVEWSRFRPSRRGRAVARAQPECQILVTTHRFGSSPLPCTTGSIKGHVTEPLECCSCSPLLFARSCRLVLG